MESEFEKVRELWKRIAVLRDAFWAIPKAGGAFVPQDREEQKAHRIRMSNEFLRRYEQARQFLSEETLSVPKHIADEANDLLKFPPCQYR